MARRKTQAKRVFGEISKLPSGRFRARYTGPDLNRHSAPGAFVARIDAEAWLAEQERAISRGDWRVPKKVVAQAPETLGEYAKAVVARRKLRPATVALYDKVLRLTIEIEVLSVAQLERYLLAVPEARRVPLLLAGWCGLRSEEVRGLRVRDLDLDAGVVHVRQAVVRLKGRLLIGPPKTAAGVRSVAIPPHLLPALKVWRDAQPTHPRDALLFPAGDGVSPLNDSVLRTAHDKGKAAIEMPGLKTHGLRHTSATMAAQLGATLAELQARIGHSTPNMAMRYQHVAAERDAELAQRMSALATGRSWVEERVEPEKPAPPREGGPGASSQSALPGLG